ncbi:biotin--[acetyl-CoA-carboxylase] ligase [Curtobacterium sp. VKM Ac-2865]|uniref:biotin--[acetyl-CoA-carboxylase] ligase n=1 Tax=Curtobacterium sp. VKM Ac-2865 TaxID=2783817 RepID=UPI00188C7FF1|nr:biotin--[acetyl-CoA-carboxylase] ligase [Curtobacterium sp. VKM Ac-2865]MBF4584213.1 biotin--[acetyl-CoA-carboxylase] ligase [Curtobacterium sp. VKM Ac-2865]
MSTPELSRSRAAVESSGAVLDVRESTGSTNADLLQAASGLPDGSVVATLDQTAGRGRLDRSWTAPTGQTLAASVLVRADLTDRDRGWLPLVAGAAMRDAVRAALEPAPDDRADGADASRASRPADTEARGTERVLVKWPNDVLVDGRKVCGILCQVAGDGAVVVGAGVNLTIPADALPTPNATSLVAAGATGDAAGLADAVLSVFVTGVREAVVALATGGADADAVRSHVRAVCGTIGARVRLELPDGGVVEADATGIDDDGRITIRDRDGVSRGVAVGDVTHLRYA